MCCDIANNSAKKNFFACRTICSNGVLQIMTMACPHLNSKAWWLLCQPSPKASSATHQLLRLRSPVL